MRPTETEDVVSQLVSVKCEASQSGVRTSLVFDNVIISPLHFHSLYPLACLSLCLSVSLPLCQPVCLFNSPSPPSPLPLSLCLCLCLCLCLSLSLSLVFLLLTRNSIHHNCATKDCQTLEEQRMKPLVAVMTPIRGSIRFHPPPPPALSLSPPPCPSPTWTNHIIFL